MSLSEYGRRERFWGTLKHSPLWKLLNDLEIPKDGEVPPSISPSLLAHLHWLLQMATFLLKRELARGIWTGG